MNFETTKEDGVRLSLEEIRNISDIVLVDSSVSTFCKSWYWDLYQRDSFRELDESRLRDDIKPFRVFYDLLRKPNVFTTKGVILECEKIKSLVRGKYNYLEDIWDFFLINSTRRDLKSNHPSKDIFFELADLLDKIYLELRKSKFTPRNRPVYKFVEDVVIDVTANTNAKIDYSFKYLDERAKPKSPEDFHTDEQIIATALYLNSIENLSVGIITGDSDLRRILLNSLVDRRLLGLRSSVETNPTRIYFYDSLGEAGCVFDSVYYIRPLSS